MSIENKHLIVFGGGISSEVFLFYFLQKLKKHPLTSPLKITQIFDDITFPSCSLNSTAFVCPRGIKKGLSPLGDHLYEAFNEVGLFIKENSPAGVNIGTITHHPGKDEVSINKFLRRYGQQIKTTENCFYFTPTIFINWIRKQNEELKQFCDFKKKHSEVKIIKHDKLITIDDEILLFDNLLICAGAYATIQENRYPQIDALKFGQVVSGSFFSFNQDLGETSFGHTFDEGYCIYRPDLKKLIIGSTSIKIKNKETEDFSLHPLHELYHRIKEEMARVGLNYLSSILIDDGEIQKGYRHKYSKNRPYWGITSPHNNIFTIRGLYKNGYGLSFLAAKELTTTLLKNLNSSVRAITF